MKSAEKGSLRETIAQIAPVYQAIVQQQKIAKGGTVPSLETIYGLAKQVRGLMGVASQMPRGHYGDNSEAVDRQLNDANSSLMYCVDRLRKGQQAGADQEMIADSVSWRLGNAADGVRRAAGEINRFLRNQHM